MKEGSPPTELARPQPGRSVTAPRVIVTGGSGFIGGALAAALAARRCAVGVVDRVPYVGGREGTIEALCAYVASADARDWMIAYRPRVIFHLVAQIDVQRSLVDPLEDARVNVLGTVNVARAAAMAGADAVVFSSSGGAIYGDCNIIPTPESVEAGP